MNRGCVGYYRFPPLSSFVMVMFQERLLARLCGFKSRQSRGKHGVSR